PPAELVDYAADTAASAIVGFDVVKLTASPTENRLTRNRAYFIASWRLNQFYAFLAIVNDECVVFSQSGPRASRHVAKSDAATVGHSRLLQSEIVAHSG